MPGCPTWEIMRATGMGGQKLVQKQSGMVHLHSPCDMQQTLLRTTVRGFANFRFSTEALREAREKVTVAACRTGKGNDASAAL